MPAAGMVLRKKMSQSRRAAAAAAPASPALVPVPVGVPDAGMDAGVVPVISRVIQFDGVVIARRMSKTMGPSA